MNASAPSRLERTIRAGVLLYVVLLVALPLLALAQVHVDGLMRHAEQGQHQLDAMRVAGQGVTVELQGGGRHGGLQGGFRAPSWGALAGSGTAGAGKTLLPYMK